MKRMLKKQFEVVEKVCVFCMFCVILLVYVCLCDLCDFACLCVFCVICVILLVYVCVHRKRLKCKHFAETYFAAGKWEYMRAGTVFTNSLVLV